MSSFIYEPARYQEVNSLPHHFATFVSFCFSLYHNVSGFLWGTLLHNRIVEGAQGYVVGYPAHTPLSMPTMHPTHIALFPCLALVIAFSRDTLTELSMSLTRLSGAKGLRDPLVAELLGEWVASSPLAKARWPEATEMGCPALNRSNQLEAVKQYASFLFPAPNLLGLLMDFNVRRVDFRAESEYISHRVVAYTAATGCPFPRPIPS